MKALGILLLLIGYSLESYACSCAPRSSTEAFDAESDVFSAQVVSTEKTTARVAGESDKPIAVERAVLVVLKVWKGNKSPGERVELQNVTERPPPTSCIDRNTTNDPLWVEILDPDVKSLPDTWLIYASGAEPYRLLGCSRSLPLPWATYRGDVGELDDLVRERAQRTAVGVRNARP